MHGYGTGRWLIAGMLVLGVIGFAPAGLTSPVIAAEAGSTSTDDQTAEQDNTLWGMIAESGATGFAFMGVLLLFSLFGATIAVERAFNTTRGKIVPADFVNQLGLLTESDERDVNAYRKLCSGNPTPAARVLEAGMLRSGRPLPEIEKAMEDAAVREMSELRSRVKPLSVVGSVAPLVGLLGTVVGMIIAFQHTASYEGPDKGGMLAKGIYLALLTTAAGLTIAIPCLLLAARFNTKLERYFREIDAKLMEVLPVLDRTQSPKPSRVPQPTQIPEPELEFGNEPVMIASAD